jgi:nucleoside-diphosphate-sugar epimerase
VSASTRSAILFGGSGFIGGHLAEALASRGYSEIVLADTSSPARPLPAGARYVFCDVRSPIEVEVGAAPLVVNLAAVHRTPGHEDHEYLDTNINGARNVVDFATRTGSTHLWFTSSIAVYGPSELALTEESALEPTSAYGRSKLAAEEIHEEWARASDDRRLVVVRPGTVFGAGEGGNFTRLASALRKRRFVYPGRKDTRKACGYVRDLVESLFFVDRLERPVSVYNFCYPVPPTIEEVCAAFCSTAGYPKPILRIPAPLLSGVARAAHALGVKDLNPERITKLVHSTNIVPGFLSGHDFRFEYELREALSDWLASDPRGRFV